MSWLLQREDEVLVLRPQNLPPGLESAMVFGRPGRVAGPTVSLEQVHGSRVEWAANPGKLEKCDAARTAVPGLTLTVRTADCLSVILTSPEEGIALVHAGWRGLVGGILENTISTFERPEAVHVLFGPAIGPCCFEVGPEVAREFSPDCRLPLGGPREHADLYREARLRLVGSGVSPFRVSGRGLCTKCNQHLFYSHRGSGGGEGRLVIAARYRPGKSQQ